MSFRRFVCWNSARLKPVLDTEALQPTKAAFLATHHPIAMYWQEGKDTNTRRPYSEEQFLEDFLATDDFAFVPVVGDSGTGKSHLIRWLEANIESSPSRKVLLLPKFGTNLRNIIERMLTLVEGPLASEYRKRLIEATETLTEAEARDHLLNSLASLITRTSESPPKNLTDLQAFLLESLPAFLYDWQVRQRLIAKDGIISRLVTHIIGTSEAIEDVDQRRRVTEADLPTSIQDIDKANVVARDVYSFLDRAEARKFVVDTLNDHLDEAIAKVLKLDREDLPTLLAAVRATLADQGIELVLLIEDFAKFQGIDLQVLEAVLVRPNQPGHRPLCALRTAFACTTGYFESLIDTIAQRADFTVTLDVGKVGENGLVSQADLETFVARYLNAVRLSKEALEDWYSDEARVEGHAAPPNRCDSCEYRATCHPAFGSQNGIGLYPFTSTALERMLARAETKGRFIPRLIIKRIIAKTLGPYERDLSAGTFPPPALLYNFGGRKLGARLVSNIETQDPKEHARREVLLDLWTDGNDLVDLDPAIHEAFDLPPLGVQIVTSGGSRPAGPRKRESIRTTPVVPAVEAKLEAKIEALNLWMNGTQLPQEVAQDLREIIYKAVCDRIEWEGEMLLRGSFTGKDTRVFLQPYVNFQNAATYNGPSKGVELLIPSDGDFKSATLALQALLRNKAYGGWDYAGGARDFRDYARQLEVWSRSVVDRIRRRATRSNALWDPVPAAVELLVLGARLGGRPTAANYTLVDLVDMMFRPLDSVDVSSRGAKWRMLVEKYQLHQPTLLDVVRSYTACPKGKAAKSQVIDASQIVKPIRSLRRQWRPICDVPEDLRTEFKPIRALRDLIDSQLDAAVDEERDRLLGWRRYVLDALGTTEVAELMRVLREAASEAKAESHFGGANPEEFDQGLARFERVGVTALLASLEPLEAEDDRGKLFDLLARVPTKKVDLVTDVVTLSKSFLEASRRRTQTDLDDLRGRGGREVEDAQRRIDEGLSELLDLVGRI